SPIGNPISLVRACWFSCSQQQRQGDKLEYDFRLDLSALPIGALMSVANVRSVYNAPWMSGHTANVKGGGATVQAPPAGCPGNPAKSVRFFYPAGHAGIDTGATQNEYYVNAPAAGSNVYNRETDLYFAPGFDINNATLPAGSNTRMGKLGC